MSIFIILSSIINKNILQLAYVVRTQPINFDHNQTNDMTTNIKSAIVRLDPPLFLL